MLGRVDFQRDMDFWQQDKWSGSFSVKWHIIKDVPNTNFRQITLENNENKPVTHSRDTQEASWMLTLIFFIVSIYELLVVLVICVLINLKMRSTKIRSPHLTRVSISRFLDYNNLVPDVYSS